MVARGSEQAGPDGSTERAGRCECKTSVLVVEDDPQIQLLFAALLDEVGLSAKIAADGA
ncbi:MAG: hypothetical protein ACRDF8_04865 [Chloroflexota bacterium]